MARFFNYTAIVICLGATGTLAISPRTAKPSTTGEVLFANDGAFRDGLYLGKLAAKDGQPLRLAIGRWSTDQDRARFTAGYWRGYEALTSTRVSSGRAQPAD